MASDGKLKRAFLNGFITGFFVTSGIQYIFFLLSQEVPPFLLENPLYVYSPYF